MPSKELIIYADESIQAGKKFSNFYGGALVRSVDIDFVREKLANEKKVLNLFGEIKWSKVTKQYLDKYQGMMDVFFALVADDRIKVRIMFTQNRFVPTGLTQEQRENTYYLLYYQFIKHAFGLRYANPSADPISLRIYLDNLPHTKEQNTQFKGYLQGLQNSIDFRQAKIKIKTDQIAEVRSHEHDILQCLDVVLGAMQFRLNELHLVKPLNSSRRGKRTIAKEKLYKHILSHIRQIYPHFNIGISTGGGMSDKKWHHRYRHWLFIPQEYEIDENGTQK